MLCPGLTLKWQTVLVRWYCVGVMSAAQLVMISLTDVHTKTMKIEILCPYIRYVKWGDSERAFTVLQALLWLRTEPIENRADMPGL